MYVSIIEHPLLAAIALTAACAAGCSAAAVAAPHTAHSTASARPPTVTRVSAPPITPPKPPPQPRVSITSVRTADRGLVTVATFLGPVRFVLHDGSADPGPVAGVRAGPVVSSANEGSCLPPSTAASSCPPGPAGTCRKAT